jgi:hypothetical protein
MEPEVVELAKTVLALAGSVLLVALIAVMSSGPHRNPVLVTVASLVTTLATAAVGFYLTG